MITLTQAEVRKKFEYDPATGFLIWRYSRGCRKAGDRAGRVDKERGYRVVSIGHGYFREHRLIWLYVHGELPPILDHINGDRADNRLANLRSVTREQSARNRAAAGYSFHKTKKRWRAVIKINRRQITLGYFREPELARAAYVAATKKYWGEFAREAGKTC